MGIARRAPVKNVLPFFSNIIPFITMAETKSNIAYCPTLKLLK
jgi:hypothetical protein